MGLNSSIEWTDHTINLWWGCQPFQQNRVYDINGISPCLRSALSCGSHAILLPEATKTEFMHFTTDAKIRRLTPRECGRLQTIPELTLDKMLNSGISDTQLYRMFGNGWTVEVIKHILSHI